MTKAKPLPPVEVLREHFSYDPDSGKVSWAGGKGTRCKGSVGCLDRGSGYLRVKLFGELYQLHRIIWKLMTSQDPTHFIDHKNRNRSDNCWKNLREASDSQSTANRSYPKGKCAPGTKQQSSGRWSTNAKMSLGTFDTEQKAHDAFVKWHREHYGEFSVYAA